ncbi:MAG: glycosyltransferase [Melioribacteraceae bacterium]|nr:glycosyltransferase [Melioribacteraceae bacterium]
MKSISIIFPAYDEQEKIQADILAADQFLISNSFEGEIIVVDDGSSDRTYEKASELISNLESDLIVLKLEENCGKGKAVAEGVKSASCDIILYSDVGLTIPFSDALAGLKFISDNECEIAHGSRRMKESVIVKQQDKDRKVISDFFIRFVKLFLGIPKNFTDTQCGFKIYKSGIAKELYSDLKITGFLFEIEIILKAIKSGNVIKEFPVNWKCDRDSRLSIFKSPWEIIKDTLKIYLNRF